MYGILRVPLFIILFVIVIIAGKQESTFKPFQRSRYSLRWGKTATSAAATATATTTTSSTTPAAATTTILSAETIMNTANAVESFTTPVTVSASAITSKQLIAARSNEKPLLSTSLPDYDYYGNNELEDNSFAQGF